MDSMDFPISRSPRKELQGPRPPALMVNKGSHKIKKPPLVPQQSNKQHQQHNQQPRPPVIIYTVSPKVIHTNPNDFMSLVQRLTGSNSSCSSSMNPFNNDGGAISPAARLASIEKATSTISKSPKGNNMFQSGQGLEYVEDILLMDQKDRNRSILSSSSNTIGGNNVNVTNYSNNNLFHGILSPGPNSLPPISPNIFSSGSELNNTISFFHDLSPVVHGNKNFIEGSFMPSPSFFNISPYINNLTSPNTPSIDLFNNFNNFFD